MTTSASSSASRLASPLPPAPPQQDALPPPARARLHLAPQHRSAATGQRMDSGRNHGGGERGGRPGSAAVSGKGPWEERLTPQTILASAAATFEGSRTLRSWIGPGSLPKQPTSSRGPPSPRSVNNASAPAPDPPRPAPRSAPLPLRRPFIGGADVSLKAAGAGCGTRPSGPCHAALSSRLSPGLGRAR